MPFQTVGSNTNLVGGYIGSGGADLGVILGMQYPGSLLIIYTAATKFGDVNNSAGTLMGGPVASGTLDTVTGAISMDLSSWFANWNGNDVIMGTCKDDGVTSPFATATWNSIMREYSLNWQSLDTGLILIPAFGHLREQQLLHPSPCHRQYGCLALNL